MPGRLASTLIGLAFLGSLHAADIYRWVDESGRTHISDTVPEQYRRSATRTDARKFEVSEEQRREAEARAERDRAKVRASEEQRARVASPESGQAAPAAARSKPAAAAAGDCAELHRRYRESLDCFAPYVMANGATKAEAYTRCTVVKDPSSQCGAPGSRESTSRTY